MAGRLREPDVPGDHCGVDLAGEVVLDLFRHLHGQIGAPVEHSQQNAFQRQLRVQRAPHNANRVHQVAETFQSEILALNRNQNAVSSTEGIQRQKLQRRRAVNENEVIFRRQLVQRVLQKKFAAVHADELNAGAGQCLVRGKHVSVSGVHHRVCGGHVGDQHLVNAFGNGFVHAHAGSGIGLWVKVAKQDALALLRQCCCQIDTGGGFAHAAFLVYDGNDFCHRPPAFRATALFDARHKCRGALRCNDSANSIITRSLQCFKAFL